MSEPIPVPGWYAAMIGPPTVSHEKAVAGRLPRAVGWLPRAPGPVRGALLWLATRHAPLVGVFRDAPGSLTLILLEALRPRRRRRVVLFEFIGRADPRRLPLRIAHRVRRAIEARAMRRSLAAAQVLTERERELYAATFSLPSGRFHHVPWPLSRTGAEPGPPPPDSRMVMSSGRARCDWETLLTAAEGRDWELVLVCGAAEAEGLRRRAAGLAQVRSELPREEHDALLREAAVYALVLEETPFSAGQVRLAAAVDAGVAIVATRVAGIEGYVEDESAVLVAPADPEALGGAIDRLLADRQERLRIRDAAHRRARSWTYGEYFEALRDLLGAAGADQSTGTR